jgi:polyglutamine-binding protein 1
MVVPSDENTDGATLSLQGEKEEAEGKKQEKWTEVRDPSTGKTYFYNSVTGVSSWTDPRAIAPKPAVSNSSLVSPWTAKQDPASGKMYYYNSATNETSWTRPPEKKEAEGEGPSPSELRTWGRSRKASKISKQSSSRKIDRAAIIGREQQF